MLKDTPTPQDSHTNSDSALHQTQHPNTYPFFQKPHKIHGHDLILRNATSEDAAFILSLRTDPKKSQHLSPTDSDLNQQIAWLKAYAKDPEQVYFVILNKAEERIGTVRLYNRIKTSFCWGSWILKEGTPPHYALESCLLVYHFACHLGFEDSHFDVRKDNHSVWKFHERFGAIKTHETPKDFFYKIFNSNIKKALEKYKKFLPHGLSIEP